MDSGKFKLVIQEFNLCDLLKECLNMITIQAKLKKIDVNTVCDRRLPKKFHSDPNRIR